MRYKIPSSVSSIAELTALISEIQEYSRWFSHYSILQRVSKKKPKDSLSLSPAAAEIVRIWHEDKTLGRGSLNNLLTMLEDTKKNAKTITITLAAPATGDIKKTLIEWCRENISPNLLVNFQFNSTILGGMVVKFGSHIFDWSFKRQILSNRTHFPEVLRRV